MDFLGTWPGNRRSAMTDILRCNSRVNSRLLGSDCSASAACVPTASVSVGPAAASTLAASFPVGPALLARALADAESARPDWTPGPTTADGVKRLVGCSTARPGVGCGVGIAAMGEPDDALLPGDSDGASLAPGSAITSSIDRPGSGTVQLSAVGADADMTVSGKITVGCRQAGSSSSGSCPLSDRP